MRRTRSSCRPPSSGAPRASRCQPPHGLHEPPHPARRRPRPVARRPSGVGAGAVRAHRPGPRRRGPARGLSGRREDAEGAVPASRLGRPDLARHGGMRFQYDPPSPLLLVAGHGLVVFHDSQLEQTSNIPIGQTPLGLLLRDRISLSGEVTVTDFRRQPGQIEVTVLHTASPGDGSLTLNFTDDPLTLRGWTVIDAQRRSTRVSLYNIQTGVSVDPKLF